jgi:DNA-binding NarL/FixJ family response regulator
MPGVETIDTAAGIDQIKMHAYSIVLASPQCLRSSTRTLVQLQERFPNKSIIGIFSTVHDRLMAGEFTDAIYLTDNESHIRTVIGQNLETNEDLTPAKQLLTEREIEVLKQFARGCAVKEVAENLHISTHTVVSHRKNISAKLGIKTTSAMAIYAVTAKLIDASEVLRDIP